MEEDFPVVVVPVVVEQNKPALIEQEGQETPESQLKKRLAQMTAEAVCLRPIRQGTALRYACKALAAHFSPLMIHPTQNCDSR